MSDKKLPIPSKIRKIVGDLLIVAVLLLTLDMSIVMIYRISTVVLKEFYLKNFIYELILCVFLLLFSLDVRFGIFTMSGSRFSTIAGRVLRVVVTVLTCVTVFFIGNVIVGSLINTAAPVEHAIVLGMALENGKPTKDLLYRLDKAEYFLENNPSSDLILTGGNPDESGRTEAAVMQELLSERGIPEEKMILEDQSSSTKQNFKNVAEITDPNSPVVLISSNYHMNRAVETAQKAGFTNVLRLPASSDPLCFGANMMWEVILDINELISPSRHPKQGNDTLPNTDASSLRTSINCVPMV